VFCWKDKYRGFLAVEMTIALTILGLLVVGLALSMNVIVRFNRHQLVRQQCIAAIQAQLDSIAATGEPVPDEEFKRLWPKLDISIEQSPGQGQWQSMKLVKVTSTGKSFRKDIMVSLSRYIIDKPLVGKVY
jgi:type II secretory pathway pseudopilin PulG